MAKDKVIKVGNSPITRVFDTETRILKRDADSEEESRTIEGYFLKFNVLSRVLNGWFKEKIDPAAFEGMDLNAMDIVCLFNHNYDIVFGRTLAKTLELGYDEVGGWFKCDVPETTDGNNLLVSVRRGDIRHCSFSFNMRDWSWIEDKDEGDIRIVERFSDIYDLGPVTNPAYLQTTVDARSFDQDKVSYEEYRKTLQSKESRSLDMLKRRLELEKLR